MISITWVEMVLLGVFAGTLAFSIGFCVSNYGKREKAKILEKSTGEESRQVVLPS
jgi:hypothetical protein